MPERRIRIATWNVAKISTRDVKLQLLSDTLRAERVEICVVTETHQRDDTKLRLLATKGWHIWTTQPSTASGAGVMVMADSAKGWSGTPIETGCDDLVPVRLVRDDLEQSYTIVVDDTGYTQVNTVEVKWQYNGGLRTDHGLTIMSMSAKRTEGDGEDGADKDSSRRKRRKLNGVHKEQPYLHEVTESELQRLVDTALENYENCAREAHKRYYKEHYKEIDEKLAQQNPKEGWDIAKTDLKAVDKGARRSLPLMKNKAGRLALTAEESAQNWREYWKGLATYNPNDNRFDATHRDQIDGVLAKMVELEEQAALRDCARREREREPEESRESEDDEEEEESDSGTEDEAEEEAMQRLEQIEEQLEQMKQAYVAPLGMEDRRETIELLNAARTSAAAVAGGSTVALLTEMGLEPAVVLQLRGVMQLWRMALSREGDTVMGGVWGLMEQHVKRGTAAPDSFNMQVRALKERYPNQMDALSGIEKLPGSTDGWKAVTADLVKERKRAWYHSETLFNGGIGESCECDSCCGLWWSADMLRPRGRVREGSRHAYGQLRTVTDDDGAQMEQMPDSPAPYLQRPYTHLDAEHVRSAYEMCVEVAVADADNGAAMPNRGVVVVMSKRLRMAAAQAVGKTARPTPPKGMAARRRYRRRRHGPSFPKKWGWDHDLSHGDEMVAQIKAGRGRSPSGRAREDRHTQPAKAKRRKNKKSKAARRAAKNATGNDEERGGS
eukprot:g2137.t1